MNAPVLFADLPLPYRLAIERLNDASLRDVRMIGLLCDGYARTYGLPLDAAHVTLRDAALAICRQRYGDLP